MTTGGSSDLDSHDPEAAAERAEWRDAAITFVPAVVVAFVLNWVFEANLHWTSRRALLTSVGIGIGVALVIQQVVVRWARR